MTPDEIKSLRRTLNLTQRQLAEALDLDVDLVRQWEREALFPTKAHCAAMEKLRQNPPPRPAKGAVPPMAVLSDPAFFALLRKLVAHPGLRAECLRLAAEVPDPAEEA
jgi:transcriptional regulator with XRE-family HTH domain